MIYYTFTYEYEASFLSIDIRRIIFNDVNRIFVFSFSLLFACICNPIAFFVLIFNYLEFSLSPIEWNSTLTKEH